MDTRREHPRVAAAFCVRYPSVDKLVEAWSVDLSRGGMFLKTTRLLPLNTVIRLDFVLPDPLAGDVAVIARVVWLRDEEEARAIDRPAGMGVEFLDMSGENEERIQRYLVDKGALPPPAPGPAKLPPRALDVLVVGGDERWRARLAAPFLERGDNARRADGAVAGLAACLKRPPDLLLVTPDAQELIATLRRRASFADVSVLVVGLHDEEARLAVFQRGADDVVDNPTTDEELLLRVDRLCARRDPPALDRKSLRGELDQIGVPAILSVLELERKTGVLLVVGDQAARVYLRDGRLMSAEIDGAPSPGRAALEEIIGWSAGQFEFACQDVAGGEGLGVTIASLVLERAAREP